MKKYIVVALLVIGVGFIFFGKSDQEKVSDADEVKPKFETVLAVAVTKDGYKVSGVVQGQSEVIVSSQVSGIAEVLVSEGQRVRAGQVIGRVKAAEYGAQVARVQAGLAQAEASERNARRHWDKLSPDEKTQIVQASKQARSALSESKAYAQKLTLRAPTSGRVMRKLVLSGETVFVGTPIVKVASERKEVEIQVPIDIANDLKLGQEVEVFIAEKKQSAQIAQIAPADAVTHRAKIKITLAQNTDLALGEFVTVSLPIERNSKNNLVSVPADAVLSIYDDSFVFAVDDSGKIQQKKIKIFNIVDDKVLVQGINSGMKVIVGDLSKVSDGYWL